MATSQNNNKTTRSRRLGALLLAAVFLGASAGQAAETDVPEVQIISVTPQTRSANDLVSEWEQPRKPSQLTGREREAILEQVSGGENVGIPLLNTIQNQGRTPEVRQLILTVKRPWYVHRAFLSSENARFVDARSVMRFDESQPGRAIVGINLVAGSTYLFDFLVDGEGEGVYTLETVSGNHEFPDPAGDRDNVLVALRAEQSGWTEVSLHRSAGSFDLHSVEVTLAVSTGDESPESE